MFEVFGVIIISGPLNGSIWFVSKEQLECDDWVIRLKAYHNIESYTTTFRTEV